MLSAIREKAYFCAKYQRHIMKHPNIMRWLFACLPLIPYGIQAETVITCSPDKRIQALLSCPGKGETGEAALRVTCEGQTIFSHIGIGLETNQQDWNSNLTLHDTTEARLHTDDYRMITGKRSHCVNHANERTIGLQNQKGGMLRVTLRVYDNGVAFRYVLDAADGECLTGEHTTYTIADGTNRWMQKHAISNEGFFPLQTDGKTTGEWGYPALCEPAGGLFALITEAGMGRAHCGSYLANREAAYADYRVRLVDRQVPMSGTWASPWRVAVIGTLADVVESTLVTDVSEPCKLDDTDWIQPGKASWIYWAHNHGTRDYQLVKSYIDLAVRMQWPYNLIDWEWDVMANGGNMEDAIAYARSKGVKPLLWYNSSTNWIGKGAPGPLFRLNKKADREKEFAWLEQLGVCGIKVDFFPDDSLWVTNYYLDLLEDAARHKLMMNFHGGILPKGWQRTYPNLVSLEAVYGAEWYNNNEVLTPRAAAHNATLPFTRNVIGPMDYTPGTFSDSQHPHITTHAHELALPVLFESAIQHMPDRPEVYESLPEKVKELLTELPTAWDDTRLLAGYPGQNVVLARRKGDTWYVAGINGSDSPARLTFGTERLGLLEKPSAMLMEDGADGRSFRITETTIAEEMTVDCLPRGGFVLVVKRQ